MSGVLGLGILVFPAHDFVSDDHRKASEQGDKEHAEQETHRRRPICGFWSSEANEQDQPVSPQQDTQGYNGENQAPPIQVAWTATHLQPESELQHPDDVTVRREGVLHRRFLQD